MNAPAWQTAWVGLGANLGDPAATLRAALAALAAHPEVRQDALSRFYRTEPIDSSGPDYVNAVVRLRTTLPPLALLDLLQDIERRHGRERPYRNAPRTLDLDLLAYDGQRLDTPRLTLPHPRMHQRAFVLRPLSDIDPDMALPQGRVEELLRACADQAVLPLD
ncbi:2-amino-4-hydroxy-6-hydroxymethyldihydropteridine diphosphokinase [Pigmentiphaga sp. GD03639]|uniref:2-amino-4-hydroxy-6-hydroxymethyldihydropteridine pyrophosphokinase n=1 Tax=Pigmentiphaga daeguensis TaxID=414049 RepID=A0ABP3LBA9_9BURK|nr:MULTISPECIES: 2-amino-4-hydroxy-6-hydroxymethyldihydropteridine diphosphokinase [unclassified Pigmentiphaga]MDH2238301.1 2-amino-4-hydroxy-6-hydroxymethyldihydropteridine diphosphokinase [Pigmentiphaga sp. GD03639]OVZ66166.1 2-amino-4-hydroxy-6-hydroxymethyldihydropteridine diphosphokinase [Pigmentiphaga sp. NML030171]